jgi:hypothetical protein
MIALMVGQIACQDLPKPAGQFRRALAPKLLASLVCLQQGLLYHVGGVDLGSQTRVQLHARQQTEVIAKALEVV